MLYHANYTQKESNSSRLQDGGHNTTSLTNHTYLGVKIDNKLSWANHIQNTTSKAIIILGLLHVRRNLCSYSSEVKAMAYKTLVRPRLEYHHKEHKLQLEGVQQRSARFVLNNTTRRGASRKCFLNWNGSAWNIEEPSRC